jgi:hypothetical protein
MNQFLSDVAKHIVLSEKNLRDVTVILPTRRAATYLIDILKNQLPSDSWLPQINTLNQWAAEMAGLSMANPVELKFLFYEAYKSVMKEAAQSINDCFAWCDILINDFNNIDGQLVDPKAIFKELIDYTEIEHFSFLDEPLSQKQERYRLFWSQIPKIHAAFKALLLKEKLGYPGMVLSAAVEKCDSYFESNDRYTYVLGFNALSISEEAVLRKLEDSNKGEVIFDGDHYYFDAPIHKAGLFLRQMEKTGLGKIFWTSKALDKRPIDIEICQADFNYQQAEMVGAILNELPPNEMAKTAVVLADETMLISVLSCLPKNAGNANITMGLGVNQSALYSWIEMFFELPNHLVSKGNSKALRNDILKGFIEHHFSLTIWGQHPKIKLKESGYSSSKQLEESLQHAPKWLKAAIDFTLNDKGSELRDLKALAKELLTHIREDKGKEIASILAQRATETWLQTLEQCSAFGAAEMDLRTLKKISIQTISKASADLLGDPLDALQIMGLLESRALGFDRIILCSLNEGNLPKKVSTDSFIPFEIALYHKLPGKSEKEAIFAYHFYRLLQHSTHAHLIFHTHTEGLGGGDKSRYIQQLEYELKRDKSEAKFSYTSLETPFGSFHEEEYKVEKTADIQAQIKAHIEDGLSASSINKYLQDPLEWFYEYIIRLKKPIETEISPAERGTAIHNVLEKLYKPLEGKVLTQDHIKEMEARVTDLLKIAVEKNKNWKEHESGTPALYFDLAKNMIEAFLKSESKRIANGEVVTMVALEVFLKKDIEVETEIGPIHAKFKGYIDRVESVNGQLKVMDYKMGKVEKSDLSMKDLESTIRKKTKGLQLLLYNWMAQSRYKTTDIEAQIISLPRPTQRDLLSRFTLADKEERGCFESELSKIVQEMISTAFEIEKKPDYKYAEYE